MAVAPGKRKVVREVMHHDKHAGANTENRCALGMVWIKLSGNDTVWVVDSMSEWDVR